MNFIFYYHVLNKKVIDFFEAIRAFYPNSYLPLDELIDSSKQFNTDDINDTIYHYTIMADDAHITNEEEQNCDYTILGYPVYFPIIGNYFFNKIGNKNIRYDVLPDPYWSLQSANFHALRGNKAYFINYFKMSKPIKSDSYYMKDTKKYLLNHTFSHLKYYINRSKVIAYFDPSYPYNWHCALYEDASKEITNYPIYKSEPLHFKNAYLCKAEVTGNTKYGVDINPTYFVAPWNNIENEIFRNTVKQMGYRYLIWKDVYDLEESKNLGVLRFCVDDIKDEDFKDHASLCRLLINAYTHERPSLYEVRKNFMQS